MNNATQFEDRASRSRSTHEGESSNALCDRLSRTRDSSQRQLPTDHDYAVSTREYQTDQSSLKPAPTAAGPALEKRQKQRQQNNPTDVQGLTGSLHISRSTHEGESSTASYATGFSRTRATSPRQLPADQDYAVSTREYQTDQPSLKPAPAAAEPCLRSTAKATATTNTTQQMRRGLTGSLHIRAVPEFTWPLRCSGRWHFLEENATRQ